MFVRHAVFFRTESQPGKRASLPARSWDGLILKYGLKKLAKKVQPIHRCWGGAVFPESAPLSVGAAQSKILNYEYQSSIAKRAI